MAPRPNHWRTVGGVIQCENCDGFHAFIVLQPVNVKHTHKYRIYAGPAQDRADAALADSIEWGLAMDSLAKDGITVVPVLDFDGWGQRDVDDLTNALPEAAAVLEALDADDAAVEVAGGVGQVAVNAPGGEA